MAFYSENDSEWNIFSGTIVLWFMRKESSSGSSTKNIPFFCRLKQSPFISVYLPVHNVPWTSAIDISWHFAYAPMESRLIFLHCIAATFITTSTCCARGVTANCSCNSLNCGRNERYWECVENCYNSKCRNEAVKVNIFTCQRAPNGIFILFPSCIRIRRVSHCVLATTAHS